MDWVEIIGWAAVALGTVNMLPQLVKTMRESDVHGLSPLSMVLGTLSSSLWLVYGWQQGDDRVAASSGIRISIWLALLGYYVYKKETELHLKAQVPLDKKGDR
eukprot:1725952-Rhodomonas_salina.2